MWLREQLSRLIIVDDASGAGTADYLRSFAATCPYAQLKRLDEQHYYTRAANIGLRESSADIVTLLNSDTIVTEGWAMSIQRVFDVWPDVGIVGPLSNAASYQSVPSIEGTQSQTAINALPGGVTPNQIARFCRERGRSVTVPFTPLIHGFCYTVSSAVMQTIGYFDEAGFPRGYGEENDYSFRAEDAGFALAVAIDSYVYHAKSKSFPDAERVEYMQSGMRELVARHSKRRIQRSTESMGANPYLKTIREAVYEAFYARATQPRRVET
jgi:GT2 family glycosyltransferase